MATGTTTVNFGSFPGVNEASVVITGQAAIVANSFAEAFVMSEASSNRTAKDHRRLPEFVALTCGDIVAGTGFTIHTSSYEKMTGIFNIRWVWI